MPVLGTHMVRRLERFAPALPAGTPVESHLFTAGRIKSALWLAGLGSHGLDGALNLCFDRAVASRLEPSPGGLFIGQPYSSLDSIRTARALGYTTVLNHVNCNLNTENEIIRAESLSLGIRPRSLWPDWIVRRVDAEVAAADAVLVPSRVVWEDLVRRGVSEHKLVLLPYGVDPDAFAPPHDRRFDTLRVLYVGQIAVRKGLQYLDRAIEHCQAPVAECLAIGPVLDRALLRHAPNVTFQPQLPSPRVRAAMQHASVFVFPSLAEGMARAVLEAMACGLPVITTREAGYDNVITSGVNGFLVPARNPEAIAEVLEMLASNPGRAQEIGHNARQTALAYTWARHGDRFQQWVGARS